MASCRHVATNCAVSAAGSWLTNLATMARSSKATDADPSNSVILLSSGAGVSGGSFLDPDDARPQTVQLYEQLRTAIVEGRPTPGDRLTPSRTVAAELHISRATVTEAYGRLSAEGYIEGHSGAAAW
jgi:hypothetical protein